MLLGIHYSDKSAARDKYNIVGLGKGSHSVDSSSSTTTSKEMNNN